MAGIDVNGRAIRFINMVQSKFVNEWESRIKKGLELKESDKLTLKQIMALDELQSLHYHIKEICKLSGALSIENEAMRKAIKNNDMDKLKEIAMGYDDEGSSIDNESEN